MRQLAGHAAVPTVIGTDRGPIAALDTGSQSGSDLSTALLVPGFTGSKEDFAPLLDPLSRAGFRAVAIDQRGQYESPGVDDPAAYTVGALAAELLAVVAQIAPDGAVHLVGHSFGGLVGRAAVIARPERFASLTLIASGPAGLVGPRADQLVYLAPLLEQAGLGGLYDVMQLLAQQDPRWQAVAPEMQQFLRERFLASSEAALRGMAEAMLSEPDRVEELAATGAPVLVLHSRHDNAWTPQAQTEMAERLGARHIVVEDAVHSPAMENPAATAAALLEFWTGIGGRQR